MRIGRANGRLVIIDGDGVVDVATVSGGDFSSHPDQVFAGWDRFAEWAGSAPARRPDRPAGAARSSARRCWPRLRCSGSA